jgi:pimeloyl-ACP methyl ester carboxylesterase
MQWMSEEQLNVAGTQVFIEGTGQRTIVMLHGWPDTRTLWRRQVEFFRRDYLCVTFTLPGFERDDRDDYSLDDIVEQIGKVIDAVSPDDKVILLVHDWGCIFGYEYAMRYSERVGSMIGLDVGDLSSEEIRRSLSVSQKLMAFTYQIVLAISFILPRGLGDPLARLVARVLDAKGDPELVHAGMSMPYAMRWFGINGGLGQLKPMKPVFPFYYAYGGRKPLMFHSPGWLSELVQNPANKVQSFDCGHWLMVDEADALNRSVAQWLEIAPDQAALDGTPGDTLSDDGHLA